MKAALLHAFKKPPLITTVDDPICPPHGVIIEMQACGVCRSDHHAWSGQDPDVQLPHIMGHELAGIIVEIGAEVRHFQIGDRVTAPFILGCGTCPDCQSGKATICEDQKVIGFNIWGAFAEYIAISHADFNLVELPENIDFSAAAALGCRMTTAYRGLLDRANLSAGEIVAIHGCGGVGLSAIIVAKAIGAQIIAVDVNEKALALARDLGANICINAAQNDDVGALIREATKGGAHVSMDALGITTTFHNSLNSLRKLGRHVQIGMPLGAHQNVNLPLLELIYSRQLQISGSRGLSASSFTPLISLIKAGKIDASALITRKIALSDITSALTDMDGYSGAGVSIITDFQT